MHRTNCWSPRFGAEEIDLVGDLERRSRAGAFVEHRRGQAGEPELAARIVARCPPSRTRLTWTIGTSCVSTSHTGRPFDSVRFWIGGQLQLRRGPAPAASIDRSGLALRGLRHEKRAGKRASREPDAESRREPKAGAESHRFSSGSTTSSTRRSAGSHRTTADWISAGVSDVYRARSSAKKSGPPPANAYALS